MNGSLKIGNVFGIPVRLHWTFLLLVYVLAAFLRMPLVDTLILLVSLFGSVFLHELGHCLVARHFGIRILDISFWPLGGMARMSDMPEDPRIEGLVAIAGPAVNFVLAILSAATMALLGGGFDPLGRLMLLNLLMGTFNLVPAFPMDGGRILRAWFARTTDWVTATEQAVAVGRFFAGLMFIGPIALMPIFGLNFCALPLIAVFVWIAGARELLGVRMRHGQPVFGAGGFRGMEHEARSAHARDAESGEQEIVFGARRPSSGRAHPPARGFTDADVRELERYRGRLKRPDP